MGRCDEITAKTNELVRRYGTRDPFKIAAELGVNVIYSDALQRLKGMYRVVKRNRFIIINSNNSERMNRIVCAHELGHDLLHRDFAGGKLIKEFVLYDMTTSQEYEANVFAADLLLDDAEMLGYISDGLDTVQIAAATETDINLVALKTDCLISEGYRLRGQEHDAKFLKGKTQG